jgi:deoxyribose-phosphate aldolase
MIDPATLSAQSLASLIDHTFLKPFGGREEIEKLCSEAVEYGFCTVAVNPAEIEACRKLLQGSEVKICTTAGFPLGQNTSDVKEYEIQNAIDYGADEIDMVLNQRAVRCGNLDLVRREFGSLAALCLQEDVISKVILECCNLTDDEKMTVCKIALEEGLDFVKTSTGLAGGGATIEDIKLMRETVGPEMGVKASGGIRSLADTFAMIRAGANRIGTSSGVAIIDEMKQSYH